MASPGFACTEASGSTKANTAAVQRQTRRSHALMTIRSPVRRPRGRVDRATLRLARISGQRPAARRGFIIGRKQAFEPKIVDRHVARGAERCERREKSKLGVAGAKV